MDILLGFAPFVVFALLSQSVPASISLWLAAAVSGGLIVRQKLRGGSMKLLEAGTFVLFAALGTYALARGGGWDIPTVRIVVDGGLLLIIVLSAVVGRPFTLQYAREQIPASVQNSPRFIQTNYIITAVWALAMSVVVLADLAMHFFPKLSVRLEIIAIVAVLGVAFWFTKWYPAQLDQRKVAS